MNLTLYTSPGSGNSYKVELFLRLLNLPYETRTVNLRQNEHLSTAFLARNRFGQIPVLVDGDAVLTDSHAILLYLAGRYGEFTPHAWAPLDPLCLARVVRWLSVSANEIQNGLAAARAIKGLNWPWDYEQAVRTSYRILKIMDEHLAGRDWLALKHATVADIACYPYVALAADGGVDTSSFGNVRRWQAAVEAIPGYWPMPRVPDWPSVPLVPVPAT
ncbi:MAG: glutathione S-transferase family protein [Gammaproteobacteria bacterium PRO9]|nr:glutathione S-transferase family protein [Gammaproteobacteria bacterium PRO9]